MQEKKILQLRLHNLHISRKEFTNIAELVSWHGAMQAQDYYGAKWALGLRLKGFNDDAIEAAVNSREIIRTWAMRGTWHFLAPMDVRWILALLAPRIPSLYGSYFRKLGLDQKTIAKSQKTIISALQNKNELTRKELIALLERKGIAMHDLRSNFILLRAAREGIICQGARRGKEFTFALLDEFVPHYDFIKGDEALAELTKRYFTSHGPATARDFAWWSGLTMKDVKRGLELSCSSLNNFPMDEQQYYFSEDNKEKISKPGTYLLPSFDEYLVAYKDRSSILEFEHTKKVLGAGNGLFSPIIVINGKIKGTWKRTLKKDAVLLEIHPFEKFSAAQSKTVKSAALDYSGFLGQKLILEMK